MRRRSDAVRGSLLIQFTMVVGLVGCAATQRPLPTAPTALGSTVDLEVLPAGEEGTFSLKPGQSTDGRAGQADHLPLPEAPAAWLSALASPLKLNLHVVVSEQGRVSDLRIDPQPAEQRCGVCAVDFVQAISAATAAWRFAPLAISDWVEVDENGDGELDSLRREVVEQRPYSLRLAVRFALVDGRSAVSAERAD